MIAAAKPLAQNTLDGMEKPWNLRWSIGGYDRYHTSSQPDTPGPWTFASIFMARANHICGNWDRSVRVVKWLCQIQGGRSGAWHEYIPVIKTNIEYCGILVWPWAEMTMFFIREVLGVTPMQDRVAITPRIPKEMGEVQYR